MAQVNLGHVVGPGIPSGGTTGQILKKASGTNFDTAWMDAGQLPEVTGLASDLAGEFNASTVYQEGDFCTNGAILYKRNSWGGSTPAAEAWDATHWTAVSVADEIQADRTAIAGEASTRAAADTALGTDVANLRSDLGIVENTNTATHTIAAGQYVIWKGLLYTASSAIPSGTTLSSSNLTAVSGGGLNSLNGNIGDLNGRFTLLAANVDLNTVKTSGLYGTRANNSHAPVANVGQLAVIQYSNDWVTQIWASGVTATRGKLYVRNFYDGTTWSDWSELALKSDSGHGTTVSLDSYTSSDYTFQSDGYVVATCESSSTSKAIVQIKDKNGNNFVKLGGWGNSTYASYSCYVKQGMKARVITLENSGHVNFEPFA